MNTKDEFTHDMAGDIPETVRAYDERVVSANDKGKENSVLHGKTDVDQEVATATGDEEHRCRRKEDGDLASVYKSMEQTGDTISIV